MKRARDISSASSQIYGNTPAAQQGPSSSARLTVAQTPPREAAALVLTVDISGSAVELELLRHIGKQIQEPPSQIASSSVSNRVLLTVGEERNKIRQRGTLSKIEFLRHLTQSAGHTQEITSRPKGAPHLMNYARMVKGTGLPQDVRVRLRELGAGNLAEALRWMEKMTAEAVFAPDDDFRRELGWQLREFWEALPHLVQPMAEGVLAAPADQHISTLQDALTQIFVRNPFWSNEVLSKAFHGLVLLYKEDHSEPEQGGLLEFRVWLLKHRCRPGFMMTLEYCYQLPLPAIQKSRRAPFILRLAQACGQADLAERTACLKYDAEDRLRKNRLLAAIETGSPELHGAMNCADLLALTARTQFEPAEAINATEPLQEMLVREMARLKNDLALLPAGKQQRELKQLLTEAPESWGRVSAEVHDLFTVDWMARAAITPGHAWSVYEMRVNRLCSVLRNFSHMVQADKKTIVSIEMRTKLREMFAQWPTKPGAKHLRDWLDQ